jgi:hypothetical protein
MTTDSRKIAATLCTLALWSQAPCTRGGSGPDTPPASPDYVRRLEAALLLQTLNADLLSHDSASVTLERWCSGHHLASPAQISAERVRATEKPATELQRQRLHVTALEEVRYRRVRLRCGTVIMSEADNWYVPARLTAQMNEQLDSTDRPFGLVVQPLHFQRHTTSAEMLWQPLPEGWEMSAPPATSAASELCLPQEVLRHRALLTLPDGTPFSEVAESYSSNLLAIPRLGLLHSCALTPARRSRGSRSAPATEVFSASSHRQVW